MIYPATHSETQPVVATSQAAEKIAAKATKADLGCTSSATCAFRAAYLNCAVSSPGLGLGDSDSLAVHNLCRCGFARGHCTPTTSTTSRCACGHAEAGTAC